MAIIAPSILSADFRKLGQEVALVEASGADWIHVDVMDGRFVPNITVGPLIVDAVRKSTKKFLDVHLMIVEPELWIEQFAAAGADQITVHVETSPHLQRTLSQIKKLGKKAGVAINPATPVDFLRYVVDVVDNVLIMTVNPGFANQAFLSNCVDKISEASSILQQADAAHCTIEVDGGINERTAELVCRAGAQVLVAGNAIFNTDNYAIAIEAIHRGAAKGAKQGL